MITYDVSVPISVDMPTYPGDPSVEITAQTALAKGDAANVSLLHFGAHTGTHVDAPAHFIEGGARVDMLPLDSLIGEAQVIEIPNDVQAIDSSHIPASTLKMAERVLFKTRNSAFWANPAGGFQKDYTYLTADAAAALVAAGVRLVGIDYLSVEGFDSTDFATHMVLLSNGVVIIEGLDLRLVAAGTYHLICLPLKIASGTGDGAPARTVLRTSN